MSEEVEKHILRKYEISSKLGKGVSGWHCVRCRWCVTDAPTPSTVLSAAAFPCVVPRFVGWRVRWAPRRSPGRGAAVCLVCGLPVTGTVVRGVFVSTPSRRRPTLRRSGGRPLCLLRTGCCVMCVFVCVCVECVYTVCASALCRSVFRIPPVVPITALCPARNTAVQKVVCVVNCRLPCLSAGCIALFVVVVVVVNALCWFCVCVPFCLFRSGVRRRMESRRQAVPHRYARPC